MTKEEYKAAQLKTIDNALAKAQELLRVSASLHEVCDAADTGAARSDEKKNYMRDTLMYFSFNDAAADIAHMPEQLADFAMQLLDLKIANDRMLPKGGFIPEIDEAVARFFLAHDLFSAGIIDEAVLDALREAVPMLEGLKKVL